VNGRYNGQAQTDYVSALPEGTACPFARRPRQTCLSNRQANGAVRERRM
jgi:hypothetical protein